MPILAVVNQKGGTGNTTVATNLATLFAGQQGEVLLVDADPQQSALEWQSDRPAHLPQVSVIGLPAPNLHREIPRLQTKYQIILIDGGGRVTATARARSKTSVIRCWRPHCRTALPIKKPLPRGWASGSTIPAARRLKRCTRSFVNCRRGYEGKVRDYRTNARAYW